MASRVAVVALAAAAIAIFAAYILGNNSYVYILGSGNTGGDGDGEVVKVAVLSTWPHEPCGVASYTRDLLRNLWNVSNSGSLRQGKIKIDMYVLDRAGDSVNVNVKDEEVEGVSIVGRIRRNVVDDYRSAAETVVSEGYGVILIQHEKMLYDGDGGSHILQFTRVLADKVPYLVTVHASRIHSLQPQHNVVKELASGASAVILVNPNEHACSEFVSDMGISINASKSNTKSKCVVLPHGVPDFPFIPSAEQSKRKEDLSEWSGIDTKDRHIILSWGLLSPDKGLERAFEAMSMLSSDAPEIRPLLVILGQPHPSVSEDYREKLVKYAENQGLVESNGVVFVSDYQKDDDLYRYLAASDIFLAYYSDLSQTCSGTLSIAMAAGLACVVTPFEHVKSILSAVNTTATAPVLGVVEWGNPMSLAERIAGLLADEDLRNIMRRNAYNYSRSFTWENIALEYYHLLLSSQSKSKTSSVR